MLVLLILNFPVSQKIYIFEYLTSGTYSGNFDKNNSMLCAARLKLHTKQPAKVVKKKGKNG